MTISAHITPPTRDSLVSIVEPPAGSSVLAIFMSMLRHRVLIARLAIVLTAATIIVFLLLPRTFTASASFVVVQSRARTGNVSAIASQLGLDVGGGAPSQQPAFFVDLIKSREILGRVVDSTYEVAGRRVSGVDLFARGKSATPARRRELAIEGLRKSIGTELATKTGIVSVAVRTRDAALSQRVAANILALVNQFNTAMRQSEAQSQRDFTESRLAEVLKELRDAEQELEDFRSHNRDFRNSPTLQTVEGRLSRVVQMRQQVYITLVSQFEDARMEQLRNTPTITVVERPIEPAAPDPRGLAAKAALALLFGLFVGVFIGLVRDSWSTALTLDADALSAYQSLKVEARSDLRNPFRFARRLIRDS